MWVPKLSHYITCNNKALASSSSSSHHHLRHLLRFYTATTQNPSPQTPFPVRYLIDSCGFSLDKATKASKYLTSLKTPQKADSVLQFLKHQGFNDSQIRTLVSCYPQFLYNNVEKTLEPKFKALHDIGISGSKLIQLLLSNPCAILLLDATSRIKFWRNVLGDEENLHKAFRRNRGLINQDISGSIAPKMSLLKDYGFSERAITLVVLRISNFITMRIDSIEELVKRTEELGFRRKSGMFVQGLSAVTHLRGGKLEKKIELFKSYGWSECEFMSAFMKAPNFTGLSESNIRAKMDFLLEEAGCELAYIALNPVLLMFSLEKSLMPRHYVLHTLKLKGLAGRSRSLVTVMTLSKQRFIEKFILSYKEEIPELHEAYAAVCAGRIPS